VLSTKLPSRNPEEAKKSLESSLKNFKTEYLDILMIHGITIDDNISDLEKGLHKTMLSFKESGMVKNIGFSCMNDPDHSRELLEKLDFDVCLVTMNATKYGGFAETILPAARKKNMGVIAMKLMRDIVGGAATPKELLEYAWTQEGVASASVGHWGIDTLQENISIAQEFLETPVTQANRKELENRLAAYAGPHALCWARPGYRDGGTVVA
jgi:predicted aldo/keto reductase-like oxidoreductase